jgi:mono/diheme cytochrome c family protein
MRLIILACLAAMVAGCAKSKEAPPITPALSKQLYAGEIVYVQYCSSCHHEDGSGAPSIMANNPVVIGDKTALINIIVKGNANHTFEGITDAEIANVLTYIRGGQVASVDSVEVASGR